MWIVISGASGLVGTALTEALRGEGHAVARLVRSGQTASADEIPWDPAVGIIDSAAMEGADAVVNLSGANIAAGRWTARRKEILRSSRLRPTRLLVETMGRLRQKPRVFLSASATGYYGNRGDEILTEASAPGSDFLAALARDWEAEAMRAESAGTRAVILRFGVILSKSGGALPRMLLPFRLGIGGRFGNGAQWMPWVALDDVTGAIRFLIANEEIRGPVNIVAPHPSTNAEFTRALARAVHRPAVLPAPAFMLHLALGEMTDALLGSQRARPARLLAAGYSWHYDELEPALTGIVQGLSN